MRTSYEEDAARGCKPRWPVASVSRSQDDWLALRQLFMQKDRNMSDPGSAGTMGSATLLLLAD